MTKEQFESQMREAKIRTENARARKYEAQARAAEDQNSSSDSMGMIKEVMVLGMMGSVISGF